MADLEPSAAKREQILQALDQASNQELKTVSYGTEKDGHRKTSGKKKKSDKANETTRKDDIRQFLYDCIHVNETVLENKLVYFMFNAGNAGAIPYLSMYGLQWGLPPWQFGLAVGAGLLAAFFFAPAWGFVADKLRWHRGMFWAVVLLWMGFTIAAVYSQQPEPAPCKVVTGQFLEALSENCDPEDPELVYRTEGQRKAYFEYMGHYPIVLQTWPEPGTANVMEFCAAYNKTKIIIPPASVTNAISAEAIATTLQLSSLSNSTEILPEAPEAQQTLIASEVTEAPYDSVLRDMHLGWLYDKMLLDKTSLIVFILAAVAGVAQISAFSLADTATLMTLGEAQRDRYGWQRSFGTMGFALSSMIVAVMLCESRGTKTLCGITWEETDYFVGVVVFAACTTISVLVSSCLQFQHNDMSSQHSFGQVMGVIFQRNYGSVFITAFFLSLCKGALNTFLYWHLHKLGATISLLVAAVAVHAVADILTSFCTVWIIRMSGYHFPLVTGILGYCVVFLSYALMSRPGWIVVIEIIHGASYAITVNTMTSYLASSVSLVSQASVQGLLSGVYWGLGPATGMALFGYLVDVIGVTLSLYALTLVSVVYGLIFISLNRHELPMIDKYLHGDYQQVDPGRVD